jgi:hypothetical protein
MRCRRSSKHSLSSCINKDWKEITEQDMIISPVFEMTDFKVDDTCLIFYENGLYSPYKGDGIYLIAAPGTVFTMIQDSLK